MHHRTTRVLDARCLPHPPYPLLSPSAFTPPYSRTSTRAPSRFFDPLLASPRSYSPPSLAPIPSRRPLSLSLQSLTAASMCLTPPRAPFPRSRPPPPLAFPLSSWLFHARDLHCSSPFCFPFASTLPRAPLTSSAVQLFHFLYRPFSALDPRHTPHSPSLFALPFPSVRAPPLRLYGIHRPSWSITSDGTA
ncbi:hypothetical protein DFH09DRAFT_1306017 [Mycena vulgaris]|nr:hypothetical protein DFH09DRAFT_1306017 [Mycena vulgaris]